MLLTLHDYVPCLDLSVESKTKKTSLFELVWVALLPFLKLASAV